MKKIFKRLTVFSILLMMVFMITGCNKKPITAEEFKTKMKDKKYDVVDITEQYSSSTEFTKVYVAVAENRIFQVEFYQFDSTDSASKAYSTTKDEVESIKGSSSANTSVELGNYSKYTLSTNGNYTIISRVEDTMIYVNVDSTYKSKVKDIVEELGY